MLWSSQVDPLDEFSTCSHVVANALHVPPTITISRKRMVITSALWLVSNGALVAKIWRFQVGGVGYEHVSACIMMYEPVSCSIIQYAKVYTGIVCICSYM